MKIKSSYPVAAPIEFLAIVLIVFAFLSAAGAGAAGNPPPFAAGEKLTFQLRWGIIPAGTAVMEVLPGSINGVASYHFVLTATSYPLIDPFYKVRDRIDAYADLEMNHSLLYKKKQQEGSSRRDEIVHFDWGKQEARYTNFGEELAPISLLPGSFDPLSIYYYIRLLALKENDVLEKPVTDGKKNIIGKARIIKRETLKLSSGTYDTFVIEPELEHIGGVFEKEKNARIRLWLTTDDRRLLVKIKSKVRVGSFVGELVAVE